VRDLAKKIVPASVLRSVRTWRYRTEQAAYPKRQIQRLYGDIRPLVELIDKKGQSWYDRDRAFEPEIEILRHYRLRPGACVFDLGAHQGVVALALAHLVGQTGRVIAVEAMPCDAEGAQRNKQLNELSQLHIINAAVAAEQGMLDFVYSGRAAWGDRSHPTVEVVATTIDDLARKHGTPDVLFMDVDGFELEALRGAATVLESRPDCYIEVHNDLLRRYGQEAADVLGFFPDDKYDLMVSCEMAPSRRRFERLDRAERNVSRGFHLLAIAKPPLISTADPMSS
jgi:FkbM family methyltransferase